jgi:hypothetical protein
VRDLLKVLVVTTVGICLIPGGAHLFELPNKIVLPPAEYMTVQRIYAGWSFFGIPIIAALLLTAVHIATVRAGRGRFLLSLSAFICLAATQAIFWTFTYPINVATHNWTVMPVDFERARQQWEYSHAVSGALNFTAFVAIVVATVVERRKMM